MKCRAYPDVVRLNEHQRREYSEEKEVQEREGSNSGISKVQRREHETTHDNAERNRISPRKRRQEEASACHFFGHTLQDPTARKREHRNNIDTARMSDRDGFTYVVYEKCE